MIVNNIIFFGVVALVVSGVTYGLMRLISWGQKKYRQIRGGRIKRLREQYKEN